MARCMPKENSTDPTVQTAANIQTNPGFISAGFPLPLPTARLDHEAPDFEAEGFHENQFKSFRLSSYRGKWVVLCFYPADFTFV